MFPARTPALLRWLLPSALWRMPSDQQAIHLTFDDGPTPGVTPWVLDELAAHGARATFFVLGKNAAAHPQLMERIRNEGHSVGNHTWEHLNGWKTSQTDYLASIHRTQALTGTRLFRPPYGRITRAQAHSLAERFTVVMWDVLSFDFAQHISGERCLKNVTRNLRPGSIIVFHDSLKAEHRLRYALPRTMEACSQMGYRMLALPESGITVPPR